MAYAGWGDVPIAEQNLIEDLYQQFLDYGGGTYPELTHDQMLGMVNAGVADLTDFGQYFVGLHDISRTPWLEFGLSKDGYVASTQDFATIWQELTGQTLDAAGAMFTEPVMAPFQSALKGHLTSAEFRQRILADTELQKTYGWLKYGLDFQSFQQQKLNMRTAFGHEMSDADAVAQLGYWHKNAGANLAVSAAPAPSTQQKQPGGGMSVVR